MADLAAHAERLRTLLLADELLVLANVWDVASARLVAGLGHPALATASAAITASLGYPDDDTIPPDEMFAAVRRITAAVEVPVTADVEAGYRLEPVELVGRLLGAGAVGMNLEDTDHHGDAEFVDARRPGAPAAGGQGRGGGGRGGRGAERARGHARPRWTRSGARASTSRRGADCVYPINLAEPDDIRCLRGGAGRAGERARAPRLADARASFSPGAWRE